MKKKISSSKKKRKNEKKRGDMNSNTKKIVITIAVLILAYIVVNSIISERKETKLYTEKTTPKVYETCEDRCSNDECLKDCYITTENIAVSKSDIDLCNTIPVQESKQSCIDKINLKLAILNKDLSKCNLIQNPSLKQTCLENAK